MDVGIRELKARLSHYVKAAHEGERITVTDRGVPVAVLSAPVVPEEQQYPERLRALIREGSVTLPTRPMPLPPVTPARATRTVAEILAEDRDDD